MRIQFKAGILEKSSGSAAVFLFEDDQPALANRAEAAAYKETIERLVKNKEFKASALAELSVKTHGGWLFLVGLGKAEDLSPGRMLEAGATAAKMAEARNLKELDLIMPGLKHLLPGDALEQAAVGCLLSSYRQGEFKSQAPPAPSLKTVRLWSKQVKKGAEILKTAEISARAVMRARRLGDMPPNLLYPQSFADEAKSLLKDLDIKIKLFDEKALTKQKLNLILAVGAGSSRGPRLLELKYQGAKKASDKAIVLVGKGVTFDSGGMSLKPAGSLEGMKTDMAGAATVLAVIAAASELKLPLNITALIPLAENMPDGGGFRVGDVLASRAGLTVEVTNTDAEGRLILADALALAAEMKPAEVIDVATLTGACVVALGDRCAGLFCDDGRLRNDILAAARQAGENFWQLPLLQDYEELLKSDTADMVSAHTVPKGGAINAALFLKRFAPKDSPWAHLDIAGPGRAAKASPGTPAGASGFAVRTLIKHLAAKRPS